MHSLKSFLQTAIYQCVGVALVCFMWFDSVSQVQQQPVSEVYLNHELAHAEAYLVSFKNDSAKAIAENLMKILDERGQIDSPFGIHVQLVEAMAIEGDQQSDLAMTKLLLVAQKSQQKKIWDVYVKAGLSLALLHEKIGRKENSRAQLDLVEATINKYKLNSLYPAFAIRRSSWERIFGDERKALYFAKQALREARNYGLVLEEAVSHLLINMLLPESIVTERMQHCLTAVKLYKQLGDYTGQALMFHAISKIYLHKQEFNLSLAYSDSTLKATSMAFSDGHERNESLGNYYLLRGEIFEKLGNLDSALVNFKAGYQFNVALKNKEISNKAIEIDARYQTKYRQQRIKEQQKAIASKNSQLQLSIISVLLVFGLAVLIFIGYRRQRRAKQALTVQNLLIQNQANRLKSLDETKSRFFGNISHELRTPLSLLLGPVETLLKEDHQPEQQRQLLRIIRANAKQLEVLVKDILNFQKLEAGKMTIDCKPTEIQSFLRSELHSFESMASRKNISYSYDVHVDIAFVAGIDREKTTVILHNLLSNAFKFTDATKTVKVTIWLQGNDLSIKVTDTGSGIPTDDIPFLFDRFFQTNQKGRVFAGGTGIGLSVCQEYVQLMGGKIKVESKLGTGSTFQAHWPVQILEKQQLIRVSETTPIISKKTVPLADPMVNHQPTILVVEDNVDLLHYLKIILSKKYQVIEAENGEVALQQIRSHGTTVKLILSDLMMPVMDGFQLLEKLKSDDTTRHVPVIMLTARTGTNDRLTALRIGVDDYITKPFREEELLVRIGNLLENQRTRKQEVQAENEGKPQSFQITENDQEWLGDFENYVRINLTGDQLTIPLLSENFAMSESTLLRQLKRLAGLTTDQYIQHIRLDEARGLLASGSLLSIYEIAMQVGYKSTRTFSRSFKKHYGKPPSDFS